MRRSVSWTQERRFAAEEDVCLQVEIKKYRSMPWIADAQIRGHVRVGVQLPG
jgi:hypothetical protein